MQDSTTLIIVGGSGDDEHSFDPLKRIMGKCMPKLKVVTFSFTSTKSHSDLPLHTQVNDLNAILDHENAASHKSCVLMATSQGAYSATHVLVNSHYGQLIKQCILVDPADYYSDTKILLSQAHSWSGFEAYEPEKKTISMLMNDIKSDVVVDVIHFALRNYDKNGYGAPSERRVDNPHKFPRLNSNMVESFFRNTPQKNKGHYVVEKTLPHAFMRDGNIDQNCETLSRIIYNLLTNRM